MLRSPGVWRNRCWQTQYCWPQIPRRSLSADLKQRDEPLRILFCGSEAFSIASLRALREFQKSKASNILSIDVATRTDKLGGRGLKEIRSPEIKHVATELGLPVHQFDTFTGWHPPEYTNSEFSKINLVIAVSFGLLVPPRILRGAKFGGLNVHPSMLPDLRGAAPVNWSVIRGDTHTGVTVQTLHPSRFDHGLILAQTPQPGLTIPNLDNITAHELKSLLAPIGADMLIEVIRSKTYLRSSSEGLAGPSETHGTELALAPKITQAMKVLNPYEDSSSVILRKCRGMPKLWAEVKMSANDKKQIKRIIFGAVMTKAEYSDFPPALTDLIHDLPVGLLFAALPTATDIQQSSVPLFLKTRDATILSIGKLLVAGGREGSAAATAAHAKFFTEPISRGSHQLYKFRDRLEGFFNDP